MNFWDSFSANALAGVVTALVAAGVGYLIAKKYTTRWDQLRARQERDQAAAAEFYRAYGEFFAAWKNWDYDRKGSARSSCDSPKVDRLTVLNQAADAEGALESFLIRLSLERPLEQPDLDRLWCFRTAYKQLRYRVREDEPLLWWRTDSERTNSGLLTDPERHAGFKAYRAFKGLSVTVAALLLRPSDKPDDQPTPARALRQLEYVTGSGTELTQRFGSALKAETSARDAAGLKGHRRSWQWVILYDELNASVGGVRHGPGDS